MLSMKEQLQQVKQQMTTSTPEKATRATTAHKVLGGHRGHLQSGRGEEPRKTEPAAVAAPQSNWKARKQKKANRKKLEKLIHFWPALFSLDNPRPLAVGIDAAIKADISARQITCRGLLLFSLGRYASHRKYLQALAAGGPRYDLNGQPAGEVTPEEQKQAVERLEAMKVKQVPTGKERRQGKTTGE